MAQLKLNIPDNLIASVINAFASVYHYEEKIVVNGEMIPNPQSKAQFAKEQIGKYVRSVYVSAKAGTDIEELRKTAIQAAESDIAVVEVE